MAASVVIYAHKPTPITEERNDHQMAIDSFWYGSFLGEYEWMVNYKEFCELTSSEKRN